MVDRIRMIKGSRRINILAIESKHDVETAQLSTSASWSLAFSQSGKRRFPVALARQERAVPTPVL